MNDDNEYGEELNQSPLEYRPSFDETEEERTAWDDSASPDDVLPPSAPPVWDKKKDLGTGIVTDIMAYIDETRTRLEESVAAFEDELQATLLPYPPVHHANVQTAKDVLGLPPGDLTLHDYKTAIQHSHTPEGEFLLSLIEAFTEGPEGTVEAELYGEYLELKEEMTLVDYYTEVLLQPMIDVHPNNDDWLDTLKTNEMAWGRKEKKINEIYAKRYDEYKRAVLFNGEQMPAARGELHRAEKAHTVLRHERNHMARVLETAQNKAYQINQMMDRMENLLDYEVNREDILSSSLLLTEDDTEATETLQHMKFLLASSIDLHNRAKHRLKNQMRNAYSVPKQKTLVDELALQHDVYYTQSLPMTHYLRSFQRRMNPDTETLFNELAQGIEESQTQGEEKMLEAYINFQSSTKQRLERIGTIEDKQSSRLNYQIFQEELTDRGRQ